MVQLFSRWHGKRCLSFALAAMMLAILTGCSSGENAVCDDEQEYQRSEGIAPLAVSEELDEPNRQGQLEIPPVPDEAELLADNPCLDRPPDYFSK